MLAKRARDYSVVEIDRRHMSNTIECREIGSDKRLRFRKMTVGEVVNYHGNNIELYCMTEPVTVLTVLNKYYASLNKAFRDGCKIQGIVMSSDAYEDLKDSIVTNTTSVVGKFRDGIWLMLPSGQEVKVHAIPDYIGIGFIL